MKELNLFSEEKGKVQVSPAAKTIKEFKKVYTKDRDRKKRTALKEMCFVYFYSDYRSPYTAYPEKDKIREIKDMADLPEEWKPDKHVKAAISRYESLQETTSIKSLKYVMSALNTSMGLIAIFEEQIKYYTENYHAISAGNSMKSEDPEDDEEVETMNDSEALRKVKDMISLSNDLPTTITKIETLLDKVKKEQSQNARNKGGGQTGAFED